MHKKVLLPCDSIPEENNHIDTVRTQHQKFILLEDTFDKSFPQFISPKRPSLTCALNDIQVIGVFHPIKSAKIEFITVMSPSSYCVAVSDEVSLYVIELSFLGRFVAMWNVKANVVFNSDARSLNCEAISRFHKSAAVAFESSPLCQIAVPKGVL